MSDPTDRGPVDPLIADVGRGDRRRSGRRPAVRPTTGITARVASVTVLAAGVCVAAALPAAAAAPLPASGGVLGSAAVVPVGAVVPAQRFDRDCADFDSQADAQAALDAQPADPENLDANRNGVACENVDYDRPDRDDDAADGDDDRDDDGDGDDGGAAGVSDRGVSRPTGQVPVVPRGSVAAGDGSAAAATETGSQSVAEPVDVLGPTLLVGGMVLLGAGLTTARYARRS